MTFVADVVMVFDVVSGGGDSSNKRLLSVLEVGEADHSVFAPPASRDDPASSK